MQNYAVDSRERRDVHVLIALVSVGLAFAVHYALQRSPLAKPWWVDSPAVMGCYALLFGAFNQFAWRWRIFRALRLVKTPDLNGRWQGHLTSSRHDHETRIPVEVTIRQEWTRIAIALRAKNSRSKSLIATILTEGADGPRILYQYLNEPLPTAIETMHSHRGTAELVLDHSGKALRGDYYTSHDRMNFGVLELRLVEEQNTKTTE